VTWLNDGGLSKVKQLYAANRWPGNMPLIDIVEATSGLLILQKLSKNEDIDITRR